jgi:hypothetical protein
LTTSDEFWSKLEEVLDRLKREGGRDRTFAEFLAEGCEDERTRGFSHTFKRAFRPPTPNPRQDL